jgi:hypothetical protein
VPYFLHIKTIKEKNMGIKNIDRKMGFAELAVTSAINFWSISKIVEQSVAKS